MRELCFFQFFNDKIHNCVLFAIIVHFNIQKLKNKQTFIQTEKAKPSHFNRTRGDKKQIFPTIIICYSKMWYPPGEKCTTETTFFIFAPKNKKILKICINKLSELKLQFRHLKILIFFTMYIFKISGEVQILHFLWPQPQAGRSQDQHDLRTGQMANPQWTIRLHRRRNVAIRRTPSKFGRIKVR